MKSVITLFLRTEILDMTIFLIEIIIYEKCLSLWMNGSRFSKTEKEQEQVFVRKKR